MSISKMLKLFNKEMLKKHNALKAKNVNVFELSEEELLNRIADLLMNADKEADWMVTLSLYCFASRQSEFSPAQMISAHMQNAHDMDLPEEEILH